MQGFSFAFSSILFLVTIRNMVKKFNNFLSKRISNIHQAAYVLAFFTLFAQLLSFVRGRLLAGEFGASLELDIYYAAFRIPDALFIFTSAIVSVWLLVPYITKTMEKGRESELVNSIFTIFLVSSSIILGIIILFTPSILELVFPNFMDTSLRDEFVLMTRVTCLSPLILGLSSFVGSIIQVERRFAIYAMTPFFYNVGTILGILFIYPVFGLPGLAYGTVLGSLMHLGIQIPSFIKSDIRPRISFNKINNDVKDLLKSSIPRTIGQFLGQSNTTILIIIAGMMSAGAISIFSMSNTIQAVTMALIGSSYILAAYPLMSSSYAKKDISGMINHMATAARHIVFWTIPASVLFLVLRAQVVRTIFGTGNFNWDDTRLVAASLGIFSISMVVQSLDGLITRAYHSADKIWKPLIINVIATSLIPISALLFITIFDRSLINLGILEFILRVDDIDNISVLLLPMVLVIITFFKVILLCLSFTRDFGGFWYKIKRTVIQSLIASVLMGISSYYSLILLTPLTIGDSGLGIFLQGLIAGLVGIFVWIIFLFTIKNKEILSVWKTVHSRIWKAKPLVEGGDVLD